MNGLQWETVDEMNLNLARRVRNIRKRKKITQSEMADMSGVSLGSIKRFENTGDISLKSLTKIAVALECQEEIRGMFTGVAYSSIEEVINEQKR